MAQIFVEDVYKTSGVPTHTFVRPASFSRLQVALRTAGRGVIVEGPSGIGKSTAVDRALQDLDIDDRITRLSARNPDDVEYVGMLPEIRSFGTVVIDDFHRLEEVDKERIADLLKVTADTEDPRRKIVIIGINDAGQSLINSSPDLTNRLDVIRFEVETHQKIQELVEAGEKALNVSLHAKDHIVEKARGSFYIAQLLCLNACVQADVIERAQEHRVVATSYSAVQRQVVERQRDRFGDAVRSFARGTKFRPGGRAPYLHILKWVSESDSWSVSLKEEMRRHPSEKASVLAVLDRGYLKNLVQSPEISKILYFNQHSSILSVEDPMLMFYLRSINWSEFVREVGFHAVDHQEEYDVALSFAGEDRDYADALRDALQDLGHTVFYDEAEQHRLLGQDLESSLGPIYESGSRYVVAIFGEMYGRKRWPLFESGQFHDRIGDGKVIPVWSTKVAPMPYDEVRSRGGLDYDPETSARDQAANHADLISRRLSE